MGLIEVYQDYLQHQSSQILSPDASMLYVPTLTSIRTAEAIGKHRIAQGKVLRVTKENLLSQIESSNAIALEVATTVDFTLEGGAFLPSLESNFVMGQTVQLPVLHLVHFNNKGFIEQIRLYWDQGSLLKQIGVIGARARSWPIRDGPEQIRSIQESSSGAENAAKTEDPFSQSRDVAPLQVLMTQSKSATHDPHASLDLFQDSTNLGGQFSDRIPKPRGIARPQERDYGDLFVGDQPLPQASAAQRGISPQRSDGPVASKAASAKPPPRDYNELFVGDEKDDSPSFTGKRNLPSNLNETPVAPKAGAGKNFRPSRLFDEYGELPTDGSTDKHSFIKTNPNKYNHFDLGDESVKAGQQTLQPSRTTTKHQPQWAFEDFTTPQKQVKKEKPDYRSQLNWDQDTSNSENQHPFLATRGAGIRGRNSHLQSTATELSLTSSNANEHGLMHLPDKTANSKGRNKDFEAHFVISDVPSPTHGSDTPPTSRLSVPPVLESRSEPNTSGSEEIDLPVYEVNKSDARQTVKHSGIKSGGDGMGGKKGSTLEWDFA